MVKVHFMATSTYRNRGYSVGRGSRIDGVQLCKCRKCDSHSRPYVYILLSNPISPLIFYMKGRGHSQHLHTLHLCSGLIRIQPPYLTVAIPNGGIDIKVPSVYPTLAILPQSRADEAGFRNLVHSRPAELLEGCPH